MSSSAGNRKDKVISLLNDLYSHDIKVFLDGDNIRIRAPKAGITDELKKTIQLHKKDLITFLRASDTVDSINQKIPKRSPDAPLYLSFLQRKLWLIDQIEGTSIHYNMALAFRVVGGLDVEVLRKSLQTIIERHESLRSIFHTNQEGNPVQIVLEEFQFDLPLIDLPTSLDLDQEASIERLCRLEANTPFCLASDLMLRAQLIRVNGREHILLITKHHIASDGWSMDILVNELGHLYEAYLKGDTHALPDLPVQYPDYSVWMHQWLQGDVLDRQLNYWLRQLEDLPALHSLPLDKPRPKSQTIEGARYSRLYPRKLYDKLEEVGYKQEVTMFMILQAAFAILLSKWSGERDVVVGTPISSRFRPELAQLIGFFTNTLVLRSDCDESLSFNEFLQSSKKMLLDAQEHQHIPFEMLIDKLSPVRDLAYNPLVQIIFTLQNNEIATIESLKLSTIDISSVAFDGKVNVKFDLELTLRESQEGLWAKWSFNTDLFEEATIARMDRYFEHLLDLLLTNPEQPIGSLNWLLPTEQKQLMHWNDTKTEFPGNSTIVNLFEEQAAINAERVALCADGKEFTYGELNALANRLAHYLINVHGVKTGALIGVFVDRSLEMLVSLLGILKAGGAYVPLDTSHPADRLEYMIQDSRATVVLTQRNILERLQDCSAQCVAIDDASLYTSFAEDNPQARCTADSLAYAIYTSGSTGRPKGTLNLQRGVCNRLHTMQRQFQLVAGDRILQKTPTSFDVSVWEIFWPLIAGATLVLAKPEGHKDPEYLIRAVDEYGITVIHFVPSMLQIFMKELNLRKLPTLRYLMTSGEALSYELQAQCIKAFPDVRMFNQYGPTETAIEVTYWPFDKLRDDHIVPIGKPAANVEIHILDQAQRSVPIGVIGELHIGGVQVGEGYLNQPALTAEKFINADVFGRNIRLYRAGDKARWLSDGNIEYLGRLDHQVKLRGVRIELGEIEATLGEIDWIKAAAVIVAGGEDGTIQTLFAYVVAADGRTSIDGLALRNSLKERLPEYMIPSHFMLLAELPLTASGKLNRRALPAPLIEQVAEAKQTLPLTPVEEILLGMCSQVLKQQINNPGLNFFDLGGHSLLAMQLVSLIKKHFEIEMPLKVIFTYPVLKDLADWITQQQRGYTLPVIEHQEEASALLSSGQRRLWLLAELDGPRAAYNIPRQFLISGFFNRKAATQAFRDIVVRHDVLRLTISNDLGSPRVKVLEPYDPVVLCDLTAFDKPQQDAELDRLSQAHTRQEFDLAIGPLFSVQIVVLAEDRYALFVNMHHIVSDGWSIGVLIREFSTLYESYCEERTPQLAPLSIQFSDYVAWHRDWFSSRIDQQRSYWHEKLSGAPALLALPTDRPRPQKISYRGNFYRKQLSSHLHRGLSQLSHAQGCTLFMTLLAVYKILLARYSGQDDICVGTPIANRSHPQTEELIGFFANTLVLRTQLNMDAPFLESLAAVRQTSLDAYSHQDFPFEQLVEEINPARSLAYSPLFQTMFRLENVANDKIEIPGVDFTYLAEDIGAAKFDVTLNVIEYADLLSCEWGFATDLFELATIERMHAHFETLLTAILNDTEACKATGSSQAVGQLSLLSDGERQDMLAKTEQREVKYARDQSIHALFEVQVSATPDVTAVEFEGNSLSFLELNRRANRIAHGLLSRGIKPDDRVAVCAERGLEIIVGILGILKAGAAYVPLDSKNPDERIRQILDDCEPAALLTQESLSHKFSAANVMLLLLDDGAHQFSEEPDVNPDLNESGFTSNNLAYVIYTSGSTGRPKGVMVEHHSVINLWQALRSTAFNTDVPQARVALNAGLFFDGSVKILIQLLSGHCLIPIPQDVRLDGASLAKFIVERRIDIFDCTPAQIDLMLDNGSLGTDAFQGKTVLIGGEAIAAHRWKELQQSSITAWNMYGPTECTVDTTITEIGKSGAQPHIGRAIDNVRTYILDRHRQLVPVGVVGELYVGGVGVARGYLNRPDLTIERFIVDPFSNKEGTRLYRTGDLVRYLPDGNIEYVGRNDFQVKIRGFRIELGEIEAMLQAHQGVREAVVIARDDGIVGKRLVAYLLAHADKEVNVSNLRAELASSLADYMLPSAYVVMEKFPLTPNGKLDRAALPTPDRDATANRAYEEPTGEVEKNLAPIWQELLGLERVGRLDNFFELGGHSLMAMRLTSRVRQALGIDVALQTVFSHPVFASFCEEVRVQVPGSEDENLIPIRASGSQTPLFLVHPGEGGIGYARDLSMWIDVDVPIYGFMASGFLQAEIRATSVEEMAARYLVAMRTVQRSGPYRIGGWSAGGTIAYEIARQLLAAGESVEFLGLIDTFSVPPKRVYLSSDDAAAHDEAKALLEWLPKQVAPDIFPRLREMQDAGDIDGMFRYCQQAGILPADVEGAILRRHLRVWLTITNATRRYALTSLPVFIQLFVATVENRESVDLGWRAIAGENMQCTPIGGNHHTIMERPHIEKLGVAISAVLNAICDQEKVSNP